MAGLRGSRRAAFGEAEALLDDGTAPSVNQASSLFDELVRTWQAEVPSVLLRLLMDVMDMTCGQQSPHNPDVARQLLRADLERARQQCRNIYVAHGAWIEDDARK